MNVGATRKLISTRIGDGGAKTGPDVHAVQQLLVAAGCRDPGVSGSWGPACNKALNAAQERHTRKSTSFVEPDDDILLDLCEDAKILIPFSGASDITGIDEVDTWATDNEIKYDPGAQAGQGVCAFYGLDFQKKKDYGIMTQHGRFEAGPVRLDCTTYANILLSVYKQGNIHAKPYDADCSVYGYTSNNHLSRERYQFTLLRRASDGKSLNYFRPNAEEILEVATPGVLYHLEVGGGSVGGVSHMAVMHNGWVYECTTGQSGCACLCRKLADFLENKQSKILYIFVQPGGGVAVPT